MGANLDCDACGASAPEVWTITCARCGLLVDLCAECTALATVEAWAAGHGERCGSRVTVSGPVRLTIAPVAAGVALVGTR